MLGVTLCYLDLTKLASYFVVAGSELTILQKGSARIVACKRVKKKKMIKQAE